MTTLSRMTAGSAEPDAGARILFDPEYVTQKPILSFNADREANPAFVWRRKQRRRGAKA